jgi:homoserine O-succinyltransferase
MRKYSLPQKLTGIYQHVSLRPNSPIFRGFDDRFPAPHSRYTGVREEDIRAESRLELMAVSDKAGVFMVKSVDSRQFFITGHPEYDGDTLAREYRRDIDKGLAIDVPENYFPGNDPCMTPVVNWRAHAQLLYTNWSFRHRRRGIGFSNKEPVCAASQVKEPAGRLFILHAGIPALSRHTLPSAV